MDQMENQLSIRPALIEEAPIVLSLWQMSAIWLNSKSIYQWRPENFHLEQVIGFMSNGSDVYLAESNNEIVGTYMIMWSDPSIWEELDNDESGYIHKFAVNRDHKGRGIGNYLLKSAEEQIKQKGKSLIRLDCMADNKRLNQYYVDYGFNFVKRADREGWSANLYEKY